MEKDALRAFEDFLRQGVNYIQLSIGNYLLVHEIGNKKKHDAKCNLCLNEGLLLFFLKAPVLRTSGNVLISFLIIAIRSLFFTDVSNENILLKKSGVYEVDDLEGLVPNDEARYHLFRYSVVFFHHNFASPWLASF